MFSPVPSMTAWPTSASDPRLPDLRSAIVDDLQDTILVRPILHPELLNQTGIIDQPVARRRPSSGLFIEGDFRIGQVSTHDRCYFRKGHGVAARVVDRVLWLVGHQHADEDLSDVIHMDGAA